MTWTCPKCGKIHLSEYDMKRCSASHLKYVLIVEAQAKRLNFWDLIQIVHAAMVPEKYFIKF